MSSSSSTVRKNGRATAFRIFSPVNFLSRWTCFPSRERRLRSWIHRLCWQRSGKVTGVTKDYGTSAKCHEETCDEGREESLTISSACSQVTSVPRSTTTAVTTKSRHASPRGGFLFHLLKIHTKRRPDCLLPRRRTKF